MIALLLACADPTTPTDPTGDTGTPLPTGDCDADLTDGRSADPWFDQAHGEVVFHHVAGVAWLAGAFQDGPTVGFHVETAREGACRLLEYEASTCSPTCAGGELCVDGECLSPARRVLGGDLAMTGPAALSASPDGTKAYFVDTTADLVPDEPVDLVGTAGTDVPAFEARTCPVVAPHPTADWSEVLGDRAPGADAVLRWDNVQPDARIRIRMTTGIGTHGGISPVEVECEGPDTGELALPGAFLDALFAEGWSCGECGGNELVRYRSGRIGATDTPFTTQTVTPFWFIPGRQM